MGKSGKHGSDEESYKKGLLSLLGWSVFVVLFGFVFLFVFWGVGGGSATY